MSCRITNAAVSYACLHPLAKRRIGVAVFLLAIAIAAARPSIGTAQPWSLPGQYYYQEAGRGGGGYGSFAPAATTWQSQAVYPATTSQSQAVYPATTSQSQAFYPSQRLNSVRVNVTVPDGASLTFDGVQTNLRGTSRLFESPPIDPGSTYRYTIQAKWTETGHEVTRSHQLFVHAGEMWHVSIGRDGVNAERGY